MPTDNTLQSSGLLALLRGKPAKAQVNSSSSAGFRSCRKPLAHFRHTSLEFLGLTMANFFSNSARAAAAAAATSSKSKPEPGLAPSGQPWVEKYRPKNLEEVRSQDHATVVLRRLVNSSNLPHLLCVSASYRVE